MSLDADVHDKRSPHARYARARDQRGIALILVLWLTILLTVIGGSFAYGMRNEALAARNTVSLAQARALADGAVYRTVFELMRPRNLTDAWVADGTVHAWDDSGGRVIVKALDESGKIDLNTAPDPLIKGLLLTAGGQDDDAASRLVDVIADWKDSTICGDRMAPRRLSTRPRGSPTSRPTRRSRPSPSCSACWG